MFPFPNTSLFLTLLSLLLCLVQPSAAQSPEESTQEEDPGDNEFKTVITPTRSEQSILDVDRTIFLVDEGDLDTGHPGDVLEAIELTPGVHAQRTNPGSASPIIRGLIGPQNLILIDGLRFNNSTFRTGPNQYLSLIDPGSLQGIEVLLGPGSVLYGSDALGGAIQLLPLSTPKGELSGKSGFSFNTADLGTQFSLHVGSGNEKVGGWVGASLRDHQTLRTGGGAHIPLSAYENRSWRSRLRYRISPSWTVRATYLGSKIDHAGRVDQLGKGDVRIYDNLDHFSYFDLVYEGQGVFESARISTLYHRTEERVDRFTCERNGQGYVLDFSACAALSDGTIARKRRYQDMVDTLGGIMEAQWSFLDGRWWLRGGLDGYLDRVQSEQKDATVESSFQFVSQPRGNFSDGSTYLQLGAFLYSEAVPYQNPDVGAFVLSTGARISHARAFAPDVPELGDISFDDTGLVVTAGARFLLFNRYALYANYSQGFRLPNLQEATVLGDTGNSFEIPNDKLASETSHTGELGIKVIHPQLELTTGYFLTLIDDVIQRSPATFEGATEIDGKEVVRRENTGEAFYHGFHAGLQTGSFLGFSLATSIAMTEGEIRRHDLVNEPARRVPPIFGQTGIRYDAFDGALRAKLFLHWALDKSDLSPEDKKDLRICENASQPGALQEDCNSLPGWNDLGFSLRWTATQDLLIYAAVHNLLDSSYRIFGSGTDSAGIHAKLGATVYF